MNLRATHFTQLEQLLSTATELIKRNEKLAKINRFVGNFISGLKKVKRLFWRLTNYQASNENYVETLKHAASSINILFNSLQSGSLKDAALTLFRKCCEVIPDSFQLSLFEWGRIDEVPAKPKLTRKTKRQTEEVGRQLSLFGGVNIG